MPREVHLSELESTPSILTEHGSRLSHFSASNPPPGGLGKRKQTVQKEILRSENDLVKQKNRFSDLKYFILMGLRLFVYLRSGKWRGFCAENPYMEQQQEAKSKEEEPAEEEFDDDNMTKIMRTANLHLRRVEGVAGGENRKGRPIKLLLLRFAFERGNEAVL